MTDLPAIGDSKSISIDVSEGLVEAFAEFSGDRNPLHLDDDFARELGFAGRVIHGMSYASFLSTLIGMHLPGHGALWASQTIRFSAPAFIGDQIELSGTVTRVDTPTRTVRMSVEAVNQNGEHLMAGESEIVMPRSKGELLPEGKASTSGAADKSQSGVRVAILAGASGDLGSAIAKTLSAAGYSVALGGRRISKLEALATSLNATGSKCLPVALDLRDDKSVAAAIEATNQSLGSVSLVVHCATLGLENLAAKDLTQETLAANLDVQAGGLLRLFNGTIDGMCQRGDGQFIYIGSTATQGPPPKGLAAYTAAKASGKSLARSIGLEYAHAGVRSNIVSPYFLDTGLNAHVSEKARMLASARTPLRRLANLEEVASMVSFLASDTSNFVNGHDLIVDGGVTMA